MAHSRYKVSAHFFTVYAPSRNLTLDDFYRQVMTRGQIHTYGNVRKGGYINITLGFEVSPSLKVIVYYVNTLGETIADSKTFDVADCFQNQVRMTLAPLTGAYFVPTLEICKPLCLTSWDIFRTEKTEEDGRNTAYAIIFAFSNKTCNVREQLCRAT